LGFKQGGRKCPKFIRLVIGAAALSVTAAALAQQPIIDPAKGQSPRQQGQDEGR
jgi:hypothetical protein